MWQYVTGPLVGAIIGYITNDVAIRMLFRPHEAKYVLGVRVPFTPGIVPKEKSRIATAVGKAIADNLMNHEVLEKSLLSPEMIAKIENAIDEFVATQRDNTQSVSEFALRFVGEDDVAAVRNTAVNSISRAAAAKLQDASLGANIAHLATDHVLQRTRNSIAGRLGADLLLERLAAPLEEHLARHINAILHDNAPAMVNRIVNDEADRLLAQPMSAVIDGRDEQVTQARSAIVSAYRAVINDHLPRILADIDISSIIEQRINDMDMDEAERVILDVMKKELRAIVWFGAMLGALMGALGTIL